MKKRTIKFGTAKKQPYNKYGNKKTVIDGNKFDSLVEGQYYTYLKELKKLGQVREFVLQPKWVLQEGYKLEDNTRRTPPITYTADFMVFYTNGNVRVIDVKGGNTTPEFKIKKKMWEYKMSQKLWEARYKNGKWEEI